MCGGQQQVEGTFINFCQAIQITNYTLSIKVWRWPPEGFSTSRWRPFGKLTPFKATDTVPLTSDVTNQTITVTLKHTKNQFDLIPVTQNPQLLKSMKNLYMFFVTSRSTKKIGTTHQFGARTVKLWRPLGKSTPIRLWQKPSLATHDDKCSQSKDLSRTHWIADMMAFCEEICSSDQISSSGIFRWYVTSLTYYQAEVYPFDSV